jgi:hypothetical protein
MFHSPLNIGDHYDLAKEDYIFRIFKSNTIKVYVWVVDPSLEG